MVEVGKVEEVIHVPRLESGTTIVKEAMQKKLKNFVNFDVYELVKDEGWQAL